MKNGRFWILISFVSRIIVFFAMFLGALWPTYLNLHQAYNNPRIVGLSHGKIWEWFYRFVLKVDSLFGIQDFLPNLFVGTPSSLTIFGIPFIDPIEAVSVLMVEPGTFLAVLPGMIAVALFTIMLGRGFCTFGCPASLFFSFNMRLRDLADNMFPWLAEQRRKLPAGLRYGILFGGVLAAIWSGAWVWNFILPYVMVSSAFINLIMGMPFSITFGVFALILLADLILFPGEVCRVMCPLGLILGRASRSALIRLKASDTSCPAGCSFCETACDLSLLPRKGVVFDCNLCGRCVAQCPIDKLSMGVKKSFFKKNPAIPVLMAVFFLSFSSITWAHHFKGVPHYGYFDNYPQVPTDEYIANNGPWEINFTLYNFQGMTRSDVETPDDLQIFLIIYNFRTDKTYGGNAQIAIRSGTKTIGSWSMVAEQESLYRFNTTILNPKRLRLFVNFVDDKGRPVEISAPFSLPGEGGHNLLLWIAGGLVALIALVALGTKQTRKKKRQ